MQVVAVIESRFEDLGICRVSRDGIVVDNGIECAAGSDPTVNRLPDFFTLFTVVSGSLIRCQRAADDLDAMRMRSFDHLL